MRHTYSKGLNKGVLLEPYDWKLSSTVLRGEGSRKGADLLDCFEQFSIVQNK